MPMPPIAPGGKLAMPGAMLPMPAEAMGAPLATGGGPEEGKSATSAAFRFGVGIEKNAVADFFF